MPKARPSYPPEFRRRLIELARAGQSPEALARKFDPSAQSRSLTRQLSLRFSGGYLSFDATAGASPACVDCSYESRRSADVVPLAAGIRLDFVPASGGTTTPFLEIAPTIFVFRINRFTTDVGDFGGPRVTEDQWIGAEPGVQLRAGLDIPLLRNGSGLNCGVQYYHSASPGPDISGTRYLSSWDWRRISEASKPLDAVGVFLGLSIH